MNKRKLVTARIIKSISPIPNADKIEVATVDGWEVVVGKGEFSVGEKVLYFEIDSMLPIDNPLFSFLEPRGITTQYEIRYHRLRTMRLRGQLSQGLILPFTNNLPKLEDYTDYFNIVKYEPPIPAALKEDALPWPGQIESTGEERLQNLSKEFLQKVFEEKEKWIATEKIDGTSVTILCGINEEGGFYQRVCSSSWAWKKSNNLYWNIATQPLIHYVNEDCSPMRYLEMKCLEYVREYSGTRELILQGELHGKDIQSNRLNLKGHHIKFFNLIVNGKRLSYSEVEKNYPELLDYWVPIHSITLPNTLKEILEQADNVKSKLNNEKNIEGFVWRHRDKVYLTENEKASFKVISNKYLLKNGG